MRRPRIVILLCVVASLLAPLRTWAAQVSLASVQRAGVPPPRARRLLRAADRARVPPPILRAWVQILADLHRDHLPTSLATGEIFEGLMKGIAPGRITDAMQAYARALQRADLFLQSHVRHLAPGTRPQAQRQALAGLVIAQRVGLGPRRLTQLLGPRRLSLGRLAAYVQVAADLRSWGMGRGRVVRILRRARRAGVPARAVLRLDARLAQAQARGHIGQHLGRELERGLGLHSALGPAMGPRGGLMGGPGGGMGMGGPGGTMGPSAAGPGGMGGGHP